MQDLSALLGQLGYDPQTVETILEWLVYLTIASLVAAVPTGLVARRQNRSVAGWVIFELCVPVLPLLILLALPGRKRTQE